MNFVKYDIIHAYFGTAGFIANLQRNTPVVTTFCGSDLLGVINNDYKYNKLKSLIFKFSSILAYKLSVFTTTLSKKLEHNLPDNKKNQIIPLGVDINHFKPYSLESAREALGWKSDEIYVLFPSEKNRPIKRYFIAKKIIQNIETDFRLNLISLDESNLYPRLPLIMSASNLLIFVSKHEGSPNVIREALSCNLPIFSFDVGDVKEQVENVTFCHCVDQDDINNMQSLISNFLKENPFVRSNGRNKMINYQWSKHVSKLVGLYNKHV